MGGLRAIGAILRASAGLDREQSTELNPVFRVVGAVHRLRAMQELEERQIVDRADLGNGHLGGLVGHRRTV
jgi:hypothetical protein